MIIITQQDKDEEEDISYKKKCNFFRPDVKIAELCKESFCLLDYKVTPEGSKYIMLQLTRYKVFLLFLILVEWKDLFGVLYVYLFKLDILCQ